MAPESTPFRTETERAVYVRAGLDRVLAHLDDYGSLSTLDDAPATRVHVAAAGGWVAIGLPDGVHPWQLHNLAFWMLDCDRMAGRPGPEVQAWSGATADHPAYWLVRDPEIFDAVCGWDEHGDGWTVLVPTNDVVRGGPVPVAPVIECPGSFGTGSDVAIRLADPGVRLNPALTATLSSRMSIAAPIDASGW